MPSSALLPPNLPSHLLRARLRGLYVITDERFGGGHLAIARAALEGGARIIQLRDKSTPLRPLLDIARQLRILTRHRALFIVNDRLDIALAAQSDGVHFGPDDLPVSVARRVAGQHFLIGASCNNADEAQQAARDGADIIGAGAIFGTQTKPDAGAPIGLEALRSIVAATGLPVAAIGGVDLSNIGALSACGAHMACVVSAVAAAGNQNAMTEATRALVQAFQTSSQRGLKGVGVGR